MFGSHKKDKPIEVRCSRCKKHFPAESLSVISIQNARFLIFACPNQRCKTVINACEAGTSK